jgi:hypothetical protein
MSYEVFFKGNKLEQFGYEQYDYILRDTQGIMPDFRVTREFTIGTTPEQYAIYEQQIKDVALKQYEDYIASLVPKADDSLMISILWVEV